eukprot:gnl/MRDRNA2_/MRDRNA2_86567_c0_seq2.p1 gnl/MRDRNA2_/MRDRNA2_86567_c0~~gnl/MRDRNA2_/MRDRNA2_86567_c0_seq2.p1  ORF type:complete len:393 (-),score=55.05 gnl/MRDRNA2_/MRDRNA2_86567_c0_seq2:340-1344(-)
MDPSGRLIAEARAKRSPKRSERELRNERSNYSLSHQFSQYSFDGTSTADLCRSYGLAPVAINREMGRADLPRLPEDMPHADRSGTNDKFHVELTAVINDTIKSQFQDHSGMINDIIKRQLQAQTQEIIDSVVRTCRTEFAGLKAPSEMQVALAYKEKEKTTKETSTTASPPSLRELDGLLRCDLRLHENEMKSTMATASPHIQEEPIETQTFLIAQDVTRVRSKQQIQNEFSVQEQEQSGITDDEKQTTSEEALLRASMAFHPALQVSEHTLEITSSAFQDRGVAQAKREKPPQREVDDVLAALRTQSMTLQAQIELLESSSPSSALKPRRQNL